MGGVPELVAPVCLGGLAAVAVGVSAVVESNLAVLGGPLLLLLLAIGAEHLPSPVAGLRSISFSCVFLVAAGILYGAATAVVLGALAIVLNWSVLAGEKPFIRVLFNASTIALSAGAAAVFANLVGGREAVLPAVLAGSLAFLGFNLIFVSGVIARAERRDFRPLVLGTLREVAFPFAMAVSIVPLLVVAWESSRVVALTAALPLTAVGLHLRSLERSREAIELALTDPLTGLGNRRHFDERLRRELDRAEAGYGPLSLILIDLNRLKSVNDRFGHEAGDRLLRGAASCLRQGGEAFRFGGDEFAILLPDTTEQEADAIRTAARQRIEHIETDDGLSAGAALGHATYPEPCESRDEFVRMADESVYRAKPSQKL